MTGATVDALARDPIAEAGFGDFFVHGLGHGVGRARPRSAQRARRGIEATLPVGATLTIEPGIYIPDWGGARIEDLVVIAETGRAGAHPRIEAGDLSSQRSVVSSQILVRRRTLTAHALATILSDH